MVFITIATGVDINQLISWGPHIVRNTNVSVNIPVTSTMNNNNNNNNANDADTLW